jgi:hypothetical protein
VSGQVVLVALLTIGLGHDVVYCLLDCRRVSIRHTSPFRAPARTAVDGIGLLVGDLDAELLLDGHDDLDRVEAVEAEVVVEVRLDVELGRVSCGRAGAGAGAGGTASLPLMCPGPCQSS